VSFYLSPIGNSQFVDTNGAPLSAGLLYAYAAGTTTPITTYADDAGTPQTNPIVLNSAGRPTLGPVWLDGGQAVKFVLQNAQAVPLYTWDDVTGVNDPAAVAQDQWVIYTGAVTYSSAVAFTVSGDQTGIFELGRKLRVVVTGGTGYGTVVVSSYNAGTQRTLVGYTRDPGSIVLDSGLSQVSYGLLSAQNGSVPYYRLGSFQTFTSSNTWTRPAGCRAVLVEVQAAGGGGGGAGNGGSGTASGAGGGAGGYARKWVTSPGATETVTLGAVGAAGADTGANGGDGASASFGAHCSATGGAGGAGTATRSATISRGAAPGGVGGVGSSGDLNVTGGCGTVGATYNTVAVSGFGGDSQLGGGGGANTEGGPGNSGGNYGGGGSGGCSDSGTGRAGGAGGAGVVVVWEYY